MAKIVVFIAETTHPLAFKPGDVTSVWDDHEELSHEVVNGARMPDGTVRRLWRIIDAPGPKTDYEYLVAQGEPVIFNDVLVTPHRLKQLNIEKLTSDVETKLGRVVAAEEAIALSKTEVLAGSKTKPSISDIVIGEEIVDGN